MNANQELRNRIRKLRRELDDRNRKSISDHLQTRFLSVASDLDLNEKTVALYRPIAEEWSLDLIEKRCEDSGCKLVYPKMDEGTDDLHFFWVKDPSSALWAVGPWGVQEPTSRAVEVDPSDIDLIFVPAVALGRQGQRLGMGKGFYDRFLPKAPQAIRISLCANFQISDSIIENPWDQRVDWIISQDFIFKKERAA